MIATVVDWLGYFTIVYFTMMQFYLLGLGITSAITLRRSRDLQRFGRVNEMLSSRTTPPVSIVIPAYNEEAGIVESIRSMSIVRYPRFEIIVVNDGSTDGTLDRLIDVFNLEAVRMPYRPDLETMEVSGTYRGHGAVDLTVIDKVNGGRADALNAGINAAKFPYVLCTDADVILDSESLLRAMQRIVEDRDRTVGVGGNVRPLNGSELRLGHLVSTGIPRKMIPRMQILEYLRTFVASRPAWSRFDALPLVSGAFGIWRRQALLAVGGYQSGHLGEDLDITMKMHRYHVENDIPYRIVYEPSAVIWTEVPATRAVLRRQRIRWHRGLMAVVHDFRDVVFNPRFGRLGMITWPGFFFFEYLAPIIEFTGWIVVPVALAAGILNPHTVVLMLLLAYGVGLLNSLIAIALDETYGYFNNIRDTSRLISMALAENLGWRQMTVLWRVRSLVGDRKTRGWGNMERQGVASLSET